MVARVTMEIPALDEQGWFCDSYLTSQLHGRVKLDVETDWGQQK